MVIVELTELGAWLLIQTPLSIIGASWDKLVYLPVSFPACHVGMALIELQELTQVKHSGQVKLSFPHHMEIQDVLIQQAFPKR